MGNTKVVFETLSSQDGIRKLEYQHLSALMSTYCQSKYLIEVVSFRIPLLKNPSLDFVCCVKEQKYKVHPFAIFQKLLVITMQKPSFKCNNRIKIALGNATDIFAPINQTIMQLYAPGKRTLQTKRNGLGASQVRELQSRKWVHLLDFSNTGHQLIGL